MRTYEIMRAIRFSGRGRTEAPFSCLPAPKLLINMWLIILGSAMTVAVCMLMLGYLGNAQIQHICEDERECTCGGFGALEWTSLLMPLRINQPQPKHTCHTIVTVVSIYA